MIQRPTDLIEPSLIVLTMSDLQGTAKPANLWAQLIAWKASLIVLADLPALVKWIKYTDTEVSEAGNVRVMLKDKQNLQKRLNAFCTDAEYCKLLRPGEVKVLSAKLVHLPVLNIPVKCIRKWENNHRCNYWAQKTKIRYRKKINK